MRIPGYSAAATLYPARRVYRGHSGAGGAALAALIPAQSDCGCGTSYAECLGAAVVGCIFSAGLGCGVGVGVCIAKYAYCLATCNSGGGDGGGAGGGGGLPAPCCGYGRTCRCGGKCVPGRGCLGGSCLLPNEVCQ
jgi:hypothetical protein